MFYSSTYEKSKEELEKKLREIYRICEKEYKYLCIDCVHNLKKGKRTYYSQINGKYVTYDISESSLFEENKNKKIKEIEDVIEQLKKKIEKIKNEI